MNGVSPAPCKEMRLNFVESERTTGGPHGWYSRMSNVQSVEGRCFFTRTHSVAGSFSTNLAPLGRSILALRNLSPKALPIR
jgi:hypothetical protein